MKKTILFLVFQIINISSFSQTDLNLNEKTLNLDKTINAYPKKGIDDFKIEFAKTLDLSTERILEINQKNIKINTNFNIDEEGKISNVKIINDKFKLRDEVTTAFSKMPNWNPAQKDGKSIASNYSLQIILNLGLPDYEFDENRIPKIVLQQKDFEAFRYEFNSHMIYPRDFWERYYYKKGGYDSGNNTTSNIFQYEVKFIVNEKGEFEDIKTYINGSYDSYLNAAVKKALKKCNPWEAATLNGEKVKSSFTYPIQLNIKK